MINLDKLQITNKSSFPTFKSVQFLKEDLYSEIDNDFDNLFTSCKSSSFGQINRKNIQITEHNLDFFKINHNGFFKLFKQLNKKNFRKFIIEKLQNANLVDCFDGLDEAMKSCSLEVNVAKATDGYENPYHVDTRRRLFHGLIYFRTDDYTGGGLSICELNKMKWDEYPQIPNNSQIINQVTFDAKNNLGLMMLSTPNSYHKGDLTKGLRRFIYFAYNMPDDNYWPKHSSWRQPLNFKEGLIYFNTNPIFLANIYRFMVSALKTLRRKLFPVKDGN